MIVAIEAIRRMRGGAQAQLMRCAGESYYVVKFQNNPQGVRILANELLGTRLAARLGVPVAAPAVVEVRPELVAQTEDLVIQWARSRAPCSAGRQFGSRYPGSPAETVVADFLPEARLGAVSNLADFCGMLVFDKWTCNTNGRQAIFFTRPQGEDGGAPQAVMIDQGFCFNAGEWNFPDAPLRGLYMRHRVYESVRGIESFEPWLSRLENGITPASLEEAASEIPPEWYNADQDALERMLEQLFRRRKLVRELLISAWKSSVQPFPNWK
ncbi:MAG TPA: HipA family kinase [Candidatus Acidoferrales bacterium]|nr:HipA family kinase [Candidatus Acidoferrales bacterium]